MRTTISPGTAVALTTVIPAEGASSSSAAAVAVISTVAVVIALV